MRRIALVLLMPLFLAACGAESTWAPDDAVQRALYRHDGPPTITLFTVMTASGKNPLYPSKNPFFSEDNKNPMQLKTTPQR